MLPEPDGPIITGKQRVWLAGFLTTVMLGILMVTCGSCVGRGLRLDGPHLYHPTVSKLNMHTPSGRGFCTAWKIGDGLLATAGHCCDAKYTYTLEGGYAPDHTSSPTILVDDDVHDVCIMRGDLDGDVIALGTEPEVGAPVWTGGYPAGWFLLSAGTWSGRDQDGRGICSSVVTQGASGSPILDERGLAVGIVTATVGQIDNLTIAATVKHIRTALLVSKTLGDDETVRIVELEDDVDALLDELLRDLKDLQAQ